MTELEPASESKATPRLPIRHGSPWKNEELHQLIDGILSGLTVTQLAEQHQRTAGGIRGAAMRLLPQALRPDTHTHSMGVLACYLRETEGLDRQSLIDAVCPVHVPRKAVRKAQDVVTNVGSSMDTSSPVDASDLNMLVSVAVASLPRERDRAVLGMRLGQEGHPLTLAEVGTEWGISRERVRQIQEGALRKLAARTRRGGTPGAVLKKLLENFCDNQEALAEWLLDAACTGFEASPGLVAKFVLRVAGISKAKAADIVSLLPAIERSRKATLRELDRSRAAAESVESVIDRWMTYSDWPAAAALPPAALQLSSHRTVNDSEIAGSFHSHKLNRTVHYESGLELEIMTLLERSERIAYYQEQPASIPYFFEGRHRTYYPDLLVSTTDGRGLLIEVKPTERMAISINRIKADAGRSWAHARGWGWLVVSDRHAFRQIHEHAVPAAAWNLLTEELRTHGALNWRDILRVRTSHGLSRFDVTAYIIQSGAEIDRKYRVTARGELPPYLPNISASSKTLSNTTPVRSEIVESDT